MSINVESADDLVRIWNDMFLSPRVAKEIKISKTAYDRSLVLNYASLNIKVTLTFFPKIGQYSISSGSNSFMLEGMQPWNNMELSWNKRGELYDPSLTEEGLNAILKCFITL